MMDGSLQEDGKTPASIDYNVKVTAEVVENGACSQRICRRRTRLLGSLESGMGESEDGHGAEEHSFMINS